MPSIARSIAPRDASVIDYGLHAVVTMGTGADVEEQLAQLAGQRHRLGQAVHDL